MTEKSAKVNTLLTIRQHMEKNFRNNNEFVEKFCEYFNSTIKKKHTSSSQMEKEVANYFNKLQENRERWRVINNITRQINSTMDVTSLYEIIIEELVAILDINFCAICVFDELHKKFTLSYIENPQYTDCCLYLSDVIEKINEAEHLDETDTESLKEIFSKDLDENYSSVPLTNKGKFLGSIFVYNKEGKINEENIQILTLVADNIASAIMNANLYSILQQKDRDKLEFIASMSHEFKNPLNTIIGFTNLLREGAINDKEKSMQYLNFISISSLHMSNLVADIIDMARAESGNIELTYEEFSPRAIILEILSTQEDLIVDKHINLKTSLNDFPISADSKRFRQVIYNLLNNAAKFAYDGGTIEVSTYCADGYFNCEIKDNGEGISKDDQSKLFKFFSQATTSVSKKREGYGIGLAVCKKVIDLHKGEINFKSEKGTGSTFWFKLPLKKPIETPETLAVNEVNSVN